MKKEEVRAEKLLYVQPRIDVVRVCHKSIICVSVTHGSSQSTEEEWENEEDIEGAEGEI